MNSHCTELSAKVINITRLRINEDGEGVRSVVFLYGCPLNCRWCCNPESRQGNGYYPMDGKPLYGHIAQDLPYFLDGRGGLTFSGGEPLLHAPFLEQFITRYCGDISVNLETSLYAPIEHIRTLIPLIDEWYMDFKVFDSAQHQAFTGVSNEVILKNLEFLATQIDGERMIITYPMVPEHNISDENLSAMLQYLRRLGLRRIQLHPYRKFQEDKHRRLKLEPVIIPELTPERYRTIRERILAEGFQTVERPMVRGRDKCRCLKQIRTALRDDLHIPVDIADCTYHGPCIGTCPKCEQELSVIRKHMEEHL